MGKFGFGKKGGGDNEDDSGNRAALFGSRSKNSKSPNPQTNPYANVPSPADAYNAAKARAGVSGYGQPPQQQQQGQPPPGPPSKDPYGGAGGRTEDRYGGGAGSGYPAEKKGYSANPYGAQGGYGGDRYASSSNDNQENTGGRSRYGTGGYGGLGPAPSSRGPDGDDNRDALFGGARDRHQQRAKQQMGYGRGGEDPAGHEGGPPPPPYEDGQGPDSQGYGGPPQPEYQPYADRQLTAEEEEEEDVTATKQQIRFIKQSDVSSTRNALRIAAQAEETGMNTLARIGAQGERIHNTEKNLDLTSNHNRAAEDKARELKKLNRSLFAVHVSNPFTSKGEQRDMDILERHQMEREQREATRRQGYQTDQRMQKTFNGLSNGQQQGGGKSGGAGGGSLAERAKYQFEADSEDDEMENEIDNNLDALGGAAARLNGLARATGKEVDEQNRHLERINLKSSKVDDEIAMNRARLDRFH